MNRIKYLRDLSKNHAGFSDHTIGQGNKKNLACKLAIYNGAKILERHITIKDPSDTRDGKVSINQKILRKFFHFQS